MTKNDLDRHISAAQQLLCALDCPRSLTVAIMIRHRMWDEIANLKLDPLAFNDSRSFFLAHQATKLLSKAKWLPTSIDKLGVAKKKFEEAETSCRLTNEYWGSYRRMEFQFLPDLEQVFHSARRKIGNVLGTQLFKWTEFCDFGPGADGSTVHGMTSAYNKLESPGSVTGGAYPYLDTFTGLTALGRLFVGNPATRMLDIALARGNKVTFVPKNAKTHRPIAVEPRWNIWMQKGLGLYLRGRLRRVGVNLDFQGLNQALAIYGSRTGKYATIDLASASDTVSYEVVQALLPAPWLTIFEALRSPAYYLDGKWREYHKWSSMGNGYTFELESLLFWALCSSVDEDVAVYGDDLIVPTKSYDKVVRVLEACGFSVNPEKSFATGPFRESCGQDAFNGDPVTPIYWKEPLDDQGTLSLVNQITVLSRRLGLPGFRSSGFKKVWKELVYQLPKRFQRRGPTTLSSVVHDCQTAWSAVRKDGWDGLHLNIEVPVPIKFKYRDATAAVMSILMRRSWDSEPHVTPYQDLRSYAIDFVEGASLGSHGYTVRDRVRWEKRTVFVPCGYEDVGPWES